MDAVDQKISSESDDDITTGYTKNQNNKKYKQDNKQNGVNEKNVSELNGEFTTQNVKGDEINESYPDNKEQSADVERNINNEDINEESFSSNISTEATIEKESESESTSCETTDPISKENTLEDDDTMTLVDYVEMQDEIEEKATLVLGASDDQDCTYSKGYVKRQALYSCKTCYETSNQLAGVCLACSMACHDGHSLIELYTKRNFRCDCGNQKFVKNPCKLFRAKSSINDLNTYNENYKGLYCSCSKPYGDVNDDETSDMLQCIICENWYHLSHLIFDGSLPNDFAEVICQFCAPKLDFLSAYSDDMVKCDVQGEESKIQNSTASKICEYTQEIQENPMNLTAEFNDVSAVKELSNQGTSCVLKNNGWCKGDVIKTAVFWNQDWRKKLCLCDNCRIMYAENGVSFLTDLQDTMEEYERNGKLNIERQNQLKNVAIAKFFSSLPHVSKIEALENYNQLKENFKTYFKKFADSKKVVNEENIREFFEQLANNKRRKLSSTPQYYCR